MKGEESRTRNDLVAHAITSGPRNHFFGYYGIQPWDPTGRYLLSLEVPFQDHPPLPDEKATIGMVELSSRKFIALSETSAWNFQQGAMMHWLPNSSGSELIFNDRVGKRAVSVILNVRTRERRVLGRAIGAVSHDGRTALGLNFGRLQWARPGYGYAGVSDPFLEDPYPSGDGIYLLDIETGDETQVIALKEIVEHYKPNKARLSQVFFIHPTYNTTDNRFAFFVQWKHYPLPKFSRLRNLGSLKTALFTVGIDGSNLCRLIDYGQASHFDWRNSEEILIWAKLGGRECFHLVTDGGDEYRPIAQSLLAEDGHCSFSPDGRWVLVDTYPDRNHFSTLKLYNWERDSQVILGRYYADPKYVAEIRCDLHPRWNRTGSEICFDSIHEGNRQVYTLDVSELTLR